MKHCRRTALALVEIAGGIAVLVFLGNLWVVLTTRGRMFDHLADVPARETALVLGTRRTLSDSHYPNPHFTHRIAAAAELYRAGKVKHLLVSGDNHVAGYDEPTDMKQALIEAGVPAKAIFLDYAGLRTLDSVVRAKDVFGQNRLVIVSERFHNYRALFISRHFGVDAIAYNAKDVPIQYSRRVKVREMLARVWAILDLYVFRTRPHLLGQKVIIPG